MSSQNGWHRRQRYTHGSIEWYTPAYIMERVKRLYNGSYFDPCPASFGHVQANGLALPWRGKVYCNPPYGRDIKPWITKAITEPTEELILLVPASTDTAWFAPLFSFALCFHHKRVPFFSCDGPMVIEGRVQLAPHATVIAYRGPHVARFSDIFCDLGPIMQTTCPQRRPLDLWSRQSADAPVGSYSIA